MQCICGTSAIDVMQDKRHLPLCHLFFRIRCLMRMEEAHVMTCKLMLQWCLPLFMVNCGSGNRGLCANFQQGLRFIKHNQAANIVMISPFLFLCTQF